MYKEWHYIVNGKCLVWLGDRPSYCDRGRYHAVDDIGFWKSDADWWPRYYFDLDRAIAELTEYLQAKKASIQRDFEIDIEAGKWYEVRHDESGSVIAVIEMELLDGTTVSAA